MVGRRLSPNHLTADEIGKLMQAAKAAGRYGQRDRTLVMITYRQGLRVTILEASSAVDTSAKRPAPYI